MDQSLSMLCFETVAHGLAVLEVRRAFNATGQGVIQPQSK